MKPAETVDSTTVFCLPGGSQENDLPVERATTPTGDPVIRSTWVPTDEEREAIANGENIELTVFGRSTPPVAMRITDVELIEQDRPEPEPVES